MQLNTALPPATFLAFIFGLLLHPISTGSHHSLSQRKIQKRLEEVFRRFSPLVTSHATLNHGQDCISPYEERLRQHIVEELHVIATSHATIGQAKDVINKMEEFISMNDKELCNYRLALVCDQGSRKCVCGPNRVNVSYIYEDHKCRYAEGSMCMVNSKIECSRETRCISLSDQKECVSGLCLCQREDYYPAIKTVPLEETNFEQNLLDNDIEGDVDFGSDKDASDVDRSHENGIQSVISTKKSLEESTAVEDEDDDKLDGEEEQIIEVNISEVEEHKHTSQLPDKSSGNHENEAVKDVFHHRMTTATHVKTTTLPAPTRRQELTTAIKRLEREVETMKRLGFGDDCSSISEESNYAEYRRLVNDMDCVTGENDEENLLEMLGKLETILETGNMMCNLTLHLQCSTQSKKCQCRTSSEDLDGFYLLFMEEGKRCVLVENSRCLSKEYLISRKSPFSSISCVSEAKCIAEETKTECKTKIENCFCRKPSYNKPTEVPKQKKSRSKGKTSPASSPFSHFFPRFKINIEVVVFLFMLVYTLLLPRLVFIM